jgi:RNA polymerase sigma factor (sigma-70 family)
MRTQPDRRLVTLVREGYEAAFEEIVRRYGRPLGRYAASIVGGRSEDVLQDAFAKALPALRRDDAEIDLRPWLFRIVRNTALNDLRDSPPSPELLAEALAGGRNPADELEQREELADLMRRLRSLPKAQRAAIVMRELEGLSHEEIAAALGITDGGARQAIYRARQALRDVAGMLVPLPLMKAFLAGAGPGAAEVAAGVGGTAGAGVAFKATAATVLVAGALGAGVALDQGSRPGKADATPVPRQTAKPDPVGRRTAGGRTIELTGFDRGDGGRVGPAGGDGGSHEGSGRSTSGPSPRHGGSSGPSHDGDAGVDDHGGESYTGSRSGPDGGEVEHEGLVLDDSSSSSSGPGSGEEAPEMDGGELGGGGSGDGGGSGGGSGSGDVGSGSGGPDDGGTNLSSSGDSGDGAGLSG